MRYLITLLLLLYSTSVQAASLRICFDVSSVNSDLAKVRVFSNSDPLYEDILASSVIDGTKRCSIQAIPATFVRGSNVQITLRGVNAFEEVGPASNALAFRAPNTPQAITGATISVVVP